MQLSSFRHNALVYESQDEYLAVAAPDGFTARVWL